MPEVRNRPSQGGFSTEGERFPDRGKGQPTVSKEIPRQSILDRPSRSGRKAQNVGFAIVDLKSDRSALDNAKSETALVFSTAGRREGRETAYSFQIRGTDRK